MKAKNIFALLMLIVAIFLLIEQSKSNPNIYFQIIGIVIFIFGMSKLSAKTPSKNNNE